MGSTEKFHLDIIGCDEAVTLPGLFRLRVERSPDAIAYRQYDPVAGEWTSYSWRDAGLMVSAWQQALAREKLAAGERVAVMLNNCIEWVCFDQAALSLGLVVVSLYTTDNPENIAYILGDCGARVLLVGDGGEWEALRDYSPSVQRVLCLRRGRVDIRDDGKCRYVDEWLGGEPPDTLPKLPDVEPGALATIIYTSGTTGRPKGVMLSHGNILRNVEAVLMAVPGYVEDIYLSFLPLSHAFERTAGYYLPVMAGSCVAYARSIQDLGEDLLAIRPTMLVSVPRIFERVYAKVQHKLQEKGALAAALSRMTEEIGWLRFEAGQGRGKGPGALQRLLWPLLKHLVADKVVSRLGGRLRLAVSGGAPLHGPISRFFIGLGLPLLQGYGLTEAAPVVSANRPENNVPESVGEPLPGIEVMIGGNDELLVRSPGVMMGYWNRPDDTGQAVDKEGWLHTGDQAEIVNNHIFIRGRLKDILVTSTGEKVAPAEMEMCITQDPLFDQALVIGEGRPYIAALLVLNRPAWQALAIALSLNPDDPAVLDSPQALATVLAKMRELLHAFPGHAQVRAVHLTMEGWSIENGLLTPTMKLKRPEIEKRFPEEIRQLYAGHDIPG